MSPEDRFSDLGSGERGRAGGRLEGGDRPGPGPDAQPGRPEMPREGNRYAWAVAIVALMGIGVLLFTTAIPNTGRGVRSLKEGERIPDFAARLATAPLAPDEEKVDANVCQRASECNEQVGTVPACELRFEGFFNVCEARERPLVLTFVFDEGADCNPQVDRVERMKDGFPGVNFAVVYFSDKKRAEVGEIVRRRKWTTPVAHTPDGAVVNLYGVGVCPTTVFVRKGGRVLESVLGPISEDELRQWARRLLRGGDGRTRP
ncbi:MAG: TlpA family protein disulfide reductase [Pseudonocardiaceae bacterium]